MKLVMQLGSVQAALPHMTGLSDCQAEHFGIDGDIALLLDPVRVSDIQYTELWSLRGVGLMVS